MTRSANRGRPPASSREMLQEAAFKLFLENSYAGTSIDQITQRAGVSRNTFFNYFAGKSDVFWVDLDETLGQLAAELRRASPDTPAMRAVADAIVSLGRNFGPSRVPFALTQYLLIGSVHELQASALMRFTRQAKVLCDFLDPKDPLLARAAAYAALGATVAAAQAWAAAGTARGDLESYLNTALTPVVDGFQTAFDSRGLT